jgi:hypothetical protein
MRTIRVIRVSETVTPLPLHWCLNAVWRPNHQIPPSKSVGHIQSNAFETFHQLIPPYRTFFNLTGEFLLHPGSSPTAVTDDHELYKVCQAQGIPPNDGHGALLYWAMELIQDFVRRVRQLTITFKLCSVSRNELPGTILEEFLENEKAFVWIDAE